MKDGNASSSRTPQWITIKDASALTQKPERTLRHQVAQGKIAGKKQGQSWMIDLHSLAANNPIAVLPVRGDITPPPPPDSTQQFSKTDGSKPFRAKNSPLRFGLFRELLLLRQELAANPKAESCLPLLDEALRNLTAGYLEFSRPKKTELYRNARERLAYLWLHLLLLLPREAVERLDEAESESTSSENAWATRAIGTVLHKLLPGLSGTLRKLEQKKKPENPEDRHDGET